MKNVSKSEKLPDLYRSEKNSYIKFHPDGLKAKSSKDIY